MQPQLVLLQGRCETQTTFNLLQDLFRSTRYLFCHISRDETVFFICFRSVIHIIESSWISTQGSVPLGNPKVCSASICSNASVVGWQNTQFWCCCWLSCFMLSVPTAAGGIPSRKSMLLCNHILQPWNQLTVWPCGWDLSSTGQVDQVCGLVLPIPHVSVTESQPVRAWSARTEGTISERLRELSFMSMQERHTASDLTKEHVTPVSKQLLTHLPRWDHGEALWHIHLNVLQCGLSGSNPRLTISMKRWRWISC